MYFISENGISQDTFNGRRRDKMHIRVSEILGRLQDFSSVDSAVLKNKTDIGKNVHEAIVQDSVGDFPLIDTERGSAFFGSYLIWKKKTNPVYRMQVPRLYCNELMITGEIDALIDNGHGDPILVDWKCSAESNEEIWSMQAHFYWYLLKVNNVSVSNTMRWVNLRERKIKEKGSLGENVLRYAASAPKIHEFNFDENILSRCIQEAQKAWEEKKNSLEIDY